MKFGIIANTSKEKVWEIIPQLVEWLSQKGVDFVLASDLAERTHVPGLEYVNRELLGELCDMIITLGGDGTILSTVRYVGESETPILGVNIGRLGFLAEITTDELFQGMENILKGSYKIERRMVLKAEIVGKGRKLCALNDIVLNRGDFSRTIKVETYVDGEHLNAYIGDGLIIATPTGSTAYSLSAGGPIVAPTLEAIIINPICPHDLAARPIIVPADKVIKIVGTSEHPEMLLCADGQEDCKLMSGEAVEVRKADYSIRLVECLGKSFYHLLRTKLNWGEKINP